MVFDWLIGLRRGLIRVVSGRKAALLRSRHAPDTMIVSAQVEILEPRALLAAASTTTVADVGVLNQIDPLQDAPAAVANQLPNDVPSIITIAASSPTAEALSKTFQDGVNGYSGTTDAEIRRGLPNSNFGSNTLLDFDGLPDIASLIRWDVSSISAGNHIESATITLDAINTSSQSYPVFAMLRPWAESQVTWRQPMNGSSWEGRGASGITDHSSAVLGQTATFSGSQMTIGLDATGIATLQNWIDHPSTNYGFIFQNYSNFDGVTFRSSESPLVSHRPILTINYSVAPNRAPTNVTLSKSTLPENQPEGTIVGKLTTTDPNTGDTFKYSFVTGTGSTDNAKFTIDTQGNLKTAASFDFEAETSYSIRVRSTDQGGLYVDKVITIGVTNVNDAPSNISLSRSTVLEKQPIGTTVGTFSTTDPDAANSFKYRLVAGAGGADNVKFTIDSSGKLKTAARFLFATKNSYSVRVRSTDQGGLFVEKTFTISVTTANAAPTAVNLSKTTIAENQPAGSTVGLFSTTDPDAANSFKYTFVSGTGSTDNAKFIVDANGNLKTSALFDFETKNSYAIRVRSTDQGGLSVEKTFTIGVTNVNEVPTALNLSTSTIAENQPIGTTVGTFSTTDPDASNTFTYSLITGTGSTDNASFTFDATGNLKTAAVFVFATKNSYSIRVRGTDQGGLSFETVVTVSVTQSTPPAVTFALLNDTGSSNADRTTSDPTIRGDITGTSGSITVEAAFDKGGTPAFQNVTDTFSGGHFTLSAARLKSLNGGTLPDATYTTLVRVRDSSGMAIPATGIQFTLDTTAPNVTQFDLVNTSDSGIVGDGQTDVARVTFTGATEPGITLKLQGTTATALTSNTGKFFLSNVDLQVGSNNLTLEASDAAGNVKQSSRTVTRLAAGQEVDPILAWNTYSLDAVRLDASTPPMATRALAMVNAAMLDVVNAIDGTPGRFVSMTPKTGLSAEAAVSAAAYQVLSYLYPAQATPLGVDLAISLGRIADGTAKTDGVDFGKKIADSIIQLRQHDGYDKFVTFNSPTGPGSWQRTAPAYAEPLLPQWGDVQPFIISDASSFLPAGPPSLTSNQWSTDFNETKSLGAVNSTTRTADQTQIARFWADGAGTDTPPGHWNQIAEQIVKDLHLSLSDNARLFAQLNLGLADAAIVAWKAKYTNDFWRPITAIQSADTDGNPLTVSDPKWAPLLVTPNFPEYVSGHSTFSGLAAEILTSVLGDHISFTIGSSSLPNVTRTYSSFNAAADEAGRSRIYCGIHFQFSNQDGLATGRKIADAVLKAFASSADTLAPAIILSPVASVIKQNVTLSGQILDNLSGVQSATLQIDGATAIPLTLDASGHFTLPTGLTTDGSHLFHFQAVDALGNTSIQDLSMTLDRQAPTITVTSPLANAILDSTSRLSGTVSGTGSAITQFTYRFDSGSSMPVSFATDGSFDVPLDISHLTVGAHTLVLATQDAAGNVTTRKVSVQTPNLIPFGISNFTPTNGSSDVGVTFRPQVFFSRSVDVTTLNSNNFFATDTTGAKVAATIVPAQDGRFAWLFFTNPLPGGSTITLHIDGSTIRASADSVLLDADGDGTLGGTLLTQFTTVSLAQITGTSLSGRVFDPGPDLKPMTFDDVRAGADGILRTDDDVFLHPIANAKVFILGLENQIVFTDANGFFEFPSAPSGTVKLAIDGRSATNAPSGVFFPEMVMDLDLVAGQSNTVMGTMGTQAERAANVTRTEVYLPRILSSSLQTVSNTVPTTVTVKPESASNLTAEQRSMLMLQVQPGTILDANGHVLTNPQIAISTVPPELVMDMLPPGLMQHTFDITIQAPGAAAFNTPLTMTFPNVFNAAPGTQLNFLSFDHTTGRLVIEGTATVSADGLSVTTDPGQGITKPGWHGVTPPGNCGGSGGAPPTPPAPDPTAGDIDNKPTVHSLPLLTGEAGILGGAFDENILNLSWTAPNRTDDGPPPPPPTNGCGIPDRPKTGQKTQPFVSVYITVDGPLNQILRKNGDVPLNSSAFILAAGSGETKYLKGSISSYSELLLGGRQLKDLANDELYGSKITVTTIHGKPDGSREFNYDTYYITRFVDSADANHSDGTISFPKALRGVARTASLNIHSGSVRLTLVPDHLPFTTSGATVSFAPSANDSSNVGGHLAVIAPDSETLLGTLILEGRVVEPLLWNLNYQDFVDLVKQKFPNMSNDPAHNEQAIFGSPLTTGDYAFDLDRTTSVYNLILTETDQKLSSYSQGVKRAVQSVEGQFNISSSATSGFGLFALTFHNSVPVFPDNGDGDIFADYSVRDIINNRTRYSVPEQNYRLSYALNQSNNDYAVLYFNPVFGVFGIRSFFLSSETEVANGFSEIITHELGHSLGLYHTLTDSFTGDDLMFPDRGSDWFLGPHRSFNVTDEAVRIALGMSYDDVGDPQRALSYFALTRAPVSSAERVIGSPLEGLVTSNKRVDVELIDNNSGGIRVGVVGSTDSVAMVRNVGSDVITIESFRVAMGADSFRLRLGAEGGVNLPVRLTPGENLTISLEFSPAQIGSERGEIEIVTDVPGREKIAVGVVGTGVTDVIYPQWGNDFVAIEYPNQIGSQILRTKSNDVGEFDAFLQADQFYHIVIFDPKTGLVAHGYGKTPSSGRGVDLTYNLVFQASTANDSDFDGLPDDIEFAIGTSPKLSDTNNDGISDFSAIEQGLDPLAGRPVVTGVLSNLPLQGEARDLVVAESTEAVPRQLTYVATGTYGLAIVDVSDFQKPSILSQIDLPGDTQDIGVDQRLNLAAIAAGNGGLLIVDVSLPTAPKLLKSISVNASHVKVKDGVAYVAVGGKLQAYDMNTGLLYQTLSLGTNSITGLTREGSVLYTMDAGNVLQAVDISGPTMLTKSSLTMPQGGGNLFVGGGIAYVAVATGGFATANVSDPNNLTLIRGVDAANIQGQAIVANGSGLALSVGSIRGPRGEAINSIDVLNVQDPSVTNGFVTRFNLPAAPQSVSVASGLAYVADGTGGLVIVNYLPFDAKGIAPTVSVDASKLDNDPAKAGIQVVEGTTASIKANINDDVQVRKVELLVDGLVVQTALSFPFNLSATMPVITGTKTTAIVQVRASDTGGNTTTSTPVTLNLTPDRTPPTLTSINPADGSKRGTSFRTIQLSFSEGMDPETFVAANFTLVNSANKSYAPTNIQFRNNNSQIQLTYDTLLLGNYTFTANSSQLADRAGNKLGGSNIVTHFEIAAFTAQFTNAAGGSWNDPNNWEGNQLPGQNDDVLIDLANDATITFDFGTSTIHSLLSNNPFTLSGGTFTVTDGMQVNDTFTMTGGTLKDTTVLLRTGNRGQASTEVANLVILDHVTLNGEFFTRNGGVVIQNGLTLNGTFKLGNPATIGDPSDPNQYGALVIQSSEKIDGNGVIEFVSDNDRNGLILQGDNTVLTIGSGITVRGMTGYLGYDPLHVASPTAVVVNEGTIKWTSGTKIVVPTTLINRGQLLIDSTGVMDIQGTVIGGTITSESGGRIAGATLNGVTIKGNLQLTSNGDLFVTNGLVVNGILTIGDLGGWGRVWFDGSQTLGGNGSVVFGVDNNVNGLLNRHGNETLTIGPDITVRGRSGCLGTSPGGGGDANGSVVNLGTIQSDVAGSVIQLTAGTTRSSGLLRATGGGSIVLNGPVDNSANTMKIEGDGTISFGNKITGGTVWIAAESRLRSNASAALDGVTINGELQVFGNSAVQIKNGLTLNGTVTLGEVAANNTFGVLTFVGTQSLSGVGKIVFGGFNDGRVVNSVRLTESGSTLTIGKDIVIQGGRGAIGYNDAHGGPHDVSVVNFGTINNLNGGTVVVGGILTNNGIINVDGVSTFTPLGTITGGEIRTQPGAKFGAGTLDAVTVTGDFSVTGNSAADVKNGLTLNGTATIGDSTANGAWGVLNFVGTQTLAGTGKVVFGGFNDGRVVNTVRLTVSGSTLTIGQNIVIRGNRGVIGFNNAHGGPQDVNIVNLGTIQSDVNGGTIVLAGASNRIVGDLVASNGGTFLFDRTIANDSNTLNLKGNGVFAFSGNIQGGTIQIAPETHFAPTGGIWDGVTVVGDFQVSGNSAINIQNGLKLNGTATIGEQAANSTFGLMNFVGSQTLSGTGTIVFGGFNDGRVVNTLRPTVAGSTLTIGKNIVIRGNRGVIGFNNAHGGPQNVNISNEGTIQSNMNGGLIAIAGESNRSSGDLIASAGGSIIMDRKIANDGNTLNLKGDGFFLFSGTIQGGIVTVAADSHFNPTGGMWDAVTLNGNFQVAGSGALNLKNGLTLNGTATVGEQAANGTFGVLNFTGTQTLAGTGKVDFGGFDDGRVVNSVRLTDAGTTLTLGKDIIIGGKRGSLGFNSAHGGPQNVSVINLGTINNLNGGTVVVGGILTNNGIINVDGVSTFTPLGTITGGEIRTQPGAKFGAGTLDAVTVTGDFSVTGNSAADVKNGLTLNGTATIGDSTANGAWGVLNFVGTQTLAGTGKVVFGGFNDGRVVNTVRLTVSGSTLTIGQNIVIRGNRGVIGFNNAHGGPQDVNIVNLGTIQSDVNGGTIVLAGASNRIVGDLVASNGGTFLFDRTIANDSNTLNLKGNGVFAFSGNIQGGTIQIAPETHFAPTGGIWDGVTVVGDFQVSGNSAINIQNGLKLNGTATIGEQAANSTFGLMNFVGSQTLSGTGTIVFGGFNDGRVVNTLRPTVAGSTLTIGKNIVIRGNRGVIGFNNALGGPQNVNISNEGTIQSDVNGGTIVLNGQTNTNNGQVVAINGGQVVIGAGLTNSSILHTTFDGSIHVLGTLTNLATSQVIIDAAGVAANQIGQLIVDGAASFNGTVDLRLVNNFQPVAGNSFKIITYGSRTGQFSSSSATNLPNGLKIDPAYNLLDVTIVVSNI